MCENVSPAPNRPVVRLAKWMLGPFLLGCATGCVAFKHVARSEPSPSLSQAWQPRYACCLGVRIRVANGPKGGVSEANEEWWSGWEANRLAERLKRCQLFKDVYIETYGYDLAGPVIEALPPPPPCSDPDNAWLLLYATAVPIYFCEDVGVRFKFIKGGSGEFVFPWEEEQVIGFWAPVVAAVAPGWRLSFITQMDKVPSGDQYWSELRAALIQVFDEALPGP